MFAESKSAYQWASEGYNFHNVGKYNEAIDCYDKALACAAKAL